MSIYADMPNKDIAEKIVALWGQVNENAHAQHWAKRVSNELKLRGLLRRKSGFI